MVLGSQYYLERFWKGFLSTAERPPHRYVARTYLQTKKCINLAGSITMTYKLGSKIVKSQFLIAKLSNRILLWLDFLEKTSFIIEFRNCQLFLQGGWLQC